MFHEILSLKGGFEAFFLFGFQIWEISAFLIQGLFVQHVMELSML